MNRFLAGFLGFSMLAGAICMGDDVFFVDGMAVDDGTRGSESESAGNLPRISMDARPPLAPERNQNLYPEKGPVTVPLSSEVMAHIKAADIFISEQQWDQALREFEAAIALDPTITRLTGRAAIVAALAKRYGLADGYFREYINRNPGDSAHLAGWGSVLIRLGRWQDVVEVSRRALAVNPSQLVARFNLLCAAIVANEAEKERDNWAHLRLHEIEQVANWLDADRKDLTEALGDDGFNLLCELTLGQGAKDQLAELVVQLRTVRELSPDVGIHVRVQEMGQLLKLGLRGSRTQAEMARLLFESGNAERALDILEHLASRYPSETQVQFDYGYVLLKSGKSSEAVEVFRRAHEQSPELGQVAFALACAQIANGQRDQAWGLLEQVAQDHPDEIEQWLAGDASYLLAIRSDPNFPSLLDASSR